MNAKVELKHGRTENIPEEIKKELEEEDKKKKFKPLFDRLKQAAKGKIDLSVIHEKTEHTLEVDLDEETERRHKKPLNELGISDKVIA